MGRLPAQQLARERARRRGVQGEEPAEPAEVLAAASSAATDTTGTSRPRPIASAMSRVGMPSSADAVQHRAGRRRLERQPEQARGVEPVDRRPAVGAVADVARDALRAGDLDQRRRRSRGRPRRAPSAPAARSTSARRARRARAASRRSAGDAVSRRPRVAARSSSVADPPARAPSVPGGDHERPVGAGQRVADRLDRRAGRPAPRRRRSPAKSWMKARWITPSACRRPPRAGRRGRRGRRGGPRRRRPSTVAAEASERASPTTWWPAPSSSGTTAEPMKPDAPVTKTRMRNLQDESMSVADITVARDVSSCHHYDRAMGRWEPDAAAGSSRPRSSSTASAASSRPRSPRSPSAPG